MKCIDCNREFDGTRPFTGKLADLGLERKVCDSCSSVRILQWCYTDEQLATMKVEYYKGEE